MILVENYNELNNIIKDITSFNIYYKNKRINIDKDNKHFSTIIDKIVDNIKKARIMPALGVSIHEETIEAMKRDCWIEINFIAEQEINDLPFDALLMRVERTSGINLIRKYKGRYQGRCIYLDFDEEITF